MNFDPNDFKIENFNPLATASLGLADQIVVYDSASGKPFRITLTQLDGVVGSGGGGSGNALTTDPLSQFAATTSAQLAGVISDETGSGALVFATSPTLVTPLLGTPTSGNLVNCTALNATQLTTGTIPDARFPSTLPALNGSLLTALNGTQITSGTVPAAQLGSGSSISTKYLRGDNTWQTISGGGDALTSGNLGQFAATTSAQLLGVISDETGTGSLVFATSPTLVTPILGTPASGNLSNCTAINGTQITSGTVPPAQLGSGASITTKFLRGDSTWQTISGGGDALTTSGLNQFAATTSAQLLGVISDETGTGALVFATNPTLTGATLAGNFNAADFEVQRPLFVDTADKITAHGAMGSTETFDHTTSDAHTGTLDADCTVTLSNPSPTGTRSYFALSITGNGTHKMIFPGSVSFGDLPTPGVIANGVVVTYYLMTDNAGTNYSGSYDISPLTVINTYTASTTLALTDRDAIMKMNHASSAMNVTFPQNSSVAIPVGASGEIWMYAAGVVTLVQGTGATLKYDSTNFTLVMAAAGSTVTWTKTGTNEFLIRGGLTVV